MFDHPFDGVDLRAHPEQYQIGRGEYGVFHAEPYKSELLPHWRFKTPEEAEKSSATIYQKYERYREDGDFVGMDLARKYLQMGYTRSRRYAKYPGGKKYQDDGTIREVDELDPDKQRSAEIFKARLDTVREDAVYQRCRDEFKQMKKQQKKNKESS